MASSIVRPKIPLWGTAAQGRTSPAGLQFARNLFGGTGGIARPAPGGGVGGGGNPYSGILNEFLNSSKSRFAADSAADAASRDAALRRFVISYGQVPDFAKLGISDSARGFLEKALDPKTRDLALKNTEEGTSVFARTKRANDVANRRIPAQLAGRGMLRSGQTGSDLSDQAQSYKIQSFDQLNEMLGGVEGTVGNFLAAERARADALAQAELQAQMAAYGEYGGDMYGDFGAAAPRSGIDYARSLLGRPGSGQIMGRPTRPQNRPVYPGSVGGRKRLVTKNSRFRRK